MRSDVFQRHPIDHLDAATLRPGNLPAELNRFVGRAAELDTLLRQLERSRLVTVTGVGGVGKTRFALAAAGRSQDRFCDGVWLAELTALRDPTLLDHCVAAALGITDHSHRRPRAVLADHLADRELLLVLDGYEQLVDQCAHLVVDLLRRAPAVRILAAGRRPLDIAGEHVMPLAPLPVPGEAVRLFADRAAAVLPGFRVEQGNRATVGELCRRLDGLPLGLELAAVRLRALSVEQLLDRLDDRFALLAGGDRSAPPRHHTLRTAIGWSHELCAPAERLLWARMSVFAGQFDLEAVEYVCAGEELAAEDVLQTVESLVCQSVVTREAGPEGVRYRMLDTVREYGAGWLEAQGDTEQLRQRHRDWFLGLATWCELDWFGPNQAEVAARISGELPNLRLALDHSLGSAEEPRFGQYLAATLWFYWAACGRLVEGRHWLERAVEVDGGNDETLAKALWALGYVSLLQGDTDAALGALQRCRDLAERTENTTAGAYALHHTGTLALLSDDLPRAEELLVAALERYRAIGELNSNVLMAQVELALALILRGDSESAVALCDEVRDICRDHGERWALAYALYGLGYAAWTRGEPERARGLLSECLTIGHGLHDLVGVTLALELLALLVEEGGDLYETAVLQGAAAALRPAVGLRQFGPRMFDLPHALCGKRARARLGPEVYADALAEGSRLDLDGAVTRALRGPKAVSAVPAARTAHTAGAATVCVAAARPAAPPRGDGTAGGR
jgi:predicted ATPase